MNKLTIIGNLTRDPELRTTTAGVDVCSFTVAVNRKRRDNQNPEADFFRVTVWWELADICAKYLSKGRKVCVIGSVSLHTYTNNKGEAGAQMEVTADDVEFLSPKDSEKQAEPVKDQQTGYEQVPMGDGDLPF